MTRRLVPIAVLALALGLAACSSTSSSSTTTTTSASTSTTAKPSTTTTTTAGPTQCSSTSLSISVGQSQGAAGHIVVPLILKNSSSTSCVTGGFPGVAGTNSAGTQVIQAARAGASKGSLTLAPGTTASATLSAVDVPSGTETSCPTLAGLLVTPPNTTASVQVITSLPGCPGLSVTALVAGSSGM